MMRRVLVVRSLTTPWQTIVPLSLRPRQMVPDRPPASGNLCSVHQWPDCRHAAVRGGWRAVVRHESIRKHLQHHCALCNHWIAKSGIRQHYRRTHAAHWNAWYTGLQQEVAVWARDAASPCTVCGAIATDARQHAGSCNIMCQAFMACKHICPEAIGSSNATQRIRSTTSYPRDSLKKCALLDLLSTSYPCDSRIISSLADLFRTSHPCDSMNKSALLDLLPC